MKIVDYIVIFTDQALKAQWKKEIANNHKVDPILIVQDNSQSFIENSQTLIEQGKWDDAIQLCDQGIKKYQNNMNLYKNKATALREKGLLKQAIDIWDEGILKNDWNMEFYNEKDIC
ncbi:unnamed protein product [Paramecium primaurelia]|uniref:Tetratricopeptide repeat protein n=1 Tax=Paramecium primaurelia TaxID=5886 RepID=A0A8S1MFV8_PARPR|nr:unnamed protein product [Paramecium primaurelia]